MLVVDVVGASFMSREHGHRLGGIALMLGVAVPACGPPSQPPAPVAKAPFPAVTSAASAATSRPVFSLIGEAVAAPTCPDPPAGEPGLLEPAFVPFAVPPDITDVNAVAGRSERDVWMTATDKNGASVALHWDGSTLSKETMSPCNLSLSHPSLSFGPSGPIVLDKDYDQFGALYSQEHRTPKGTWECDERRALGRSFTFGAEVLRFDSSASSPALSGRLLPGPDDADLLEGPGELLVCAIDDVWIRYPWLPAVWHWNGLSYEKRSTGLRGIAGMFADARCDVWLLGRREMEDGSKRVSKVMLRWDRSAQTWVCLPTPSGLEIERLLSANERDVWLLGESEASHWDGTSFQRGLTPIKSIKDAWISTSGELWIVGGEMLDSGSRGLVFRVVAGGKP